MNNIAIIETKKSKNNYHQRFDGEFKFDQYQLCSDPNIKKVLKRDVDIDIDLDAYTWIILVGSDALKYFTKINSVTIYSGKLIDEKFLPIINPAMLAFKPEASQLWESSKTNIIKYIKGEIEVVLIDDSIAKGIYVTSKANEFIKDAIKYDCEYISLDSETTALYPRNGWMQGFSICYDGKFGAYVDIDCVDETTEELLQELFDKKIVIFHNAKFDISFFEYHFGFKFYRFEDTMLLHYLIDENPGNHGLKQLAIHFTRFGNYEDEKDKWVADYCRAHGVLKANFQWEWIPFEIMYPYAAMDALVTYLLYEKFRKIKKNPKLKWVYDNILIPATRFLVDVQDTGVPFDKTRLYNAQELMQLEIDEAINKLYEHKEVREFEEFQKKDFNPNSVVQLRVLLFDFLGLKPTGKKTPKGANSTDAEVLTALSKQSEVPGLILTIRQKSKIKNTYLDKILPQLDKDSRLRTGFNLHTTTSGRLSSSGKLNMQQLPRDNPIVKGCIKARPGYKIVAMDLTTAEMYVAAVLAKDTALMEVFRTGQNFHSMMAKKVFKLPCEAKDVQELFPRQRQAVKAVSFGILYGAGPHKISEEITKESGKVFTIGDAKEVINDYFKSFPKLRNWIDFNRTFIADNGFIYSYFGRKRRLPNVFSSDRGIVGHSIRSGLNFLVQSAASDINLLGAIDMHSYIKVSKIDAGIFALVHDSILAEVKDEDILEYQENLTRFIQMDRGIIISGTPIGCDYDIHQDYSMGKYEKKYEK